MSRSTSAEIVYGIDLGDAEYGEDFIGLDDTVTQELRIDFDVDRTGTLERLLDEFRAAGDPPPAYPTDATAGTWREWKVSYDAWATDHPTHLFFTSYGYELNGTVLAMRTAGSGDLTPAVIDPGAFRANLGAAEWELSRFLTFLDNHGVVVDADCRQPNWLLTAAFG